MNRSFIRYLIGRVLLVFSGLLLLPLIVSLLNPEPAINRYGFLIAIVLSLLIGLILSRKKPKSTRIFAREGMILSALLWIILAAIGAIPLFVTKAYPGFLDSLFEMVSAFTGTGLSLATDIGNLDRSILFWRSFSQLIGGLGILVIAIDLIPNLTSSNQRKSNPDLSVSSTKKLNLKLFEWPSVVYLIYLVITGIIFVLLLLGKMPAFDALCQAFATAGTGTFSTEGASLAIKSSYFIRWVLSIGMLIFSLNFEFLYPLIVKRDFDSKKDEEFKWFIGIVLCAFVVMLLILRPSYQKASGKSIGALVTDSVFSVSSMISTTGSSAFDFTIFPIAAQLILLILMFVGGCSGSIASGFKVSRVAMKMKIARGAFLIKRKPNRIAPAIFNDHPIAERRKKILQGYGVVYGMLFLILFLTLSFEGPNIESALYTAASAINNVGPGLSSPQSLIGICPLSKIILSLGMIAGRLEIWPIIMIFTPKSWSKY